MTTNRQAVRFGPFKEFIANGVKIDDTIYLSGQVSLDNEGNVVGAGDLGAQVRQAYANVKEVLAGFDAAMENIVDEMLLLTDIQEAMGNIEQLFGIRAEAYGGNPDVTQTMVQVAALAMPELLIEIKCIARV
ncbi:MAG: RidA family protein [Myxococcales bacterium]|jgi:2-iminobutanoate/2-iminopropanoate deaminase|nr:MAG: RidA family protein [Myxococcales bacterium]